jgi:phosphoglycolate phosphatase
MRGFVAFDLDGVLYSSEPFLGQAYREAIAAVENQYPGSFPRLPETQEILAHVGWPVPVLLRRLFPQVAQEAVDLLSRQMLPVICRHVAGREGVLFPGVGETLARIAAEGVVLGIASNGRRLYVETVLATYALTEYFTDLITVDQPGYPDKASVLRAYLERLGIGSADTVMVGDRRSDVEAAKAVGCAFVGCDYGHGHRAEIESAGPVVSRFADLPEVLTALLSRPVVTLPLEPHVFECQLCHKVFESRRRRPVCPECDSSDTELMSE